MRREPQILTKLAYATDSAWTDAVLQDFDRFLQDHAAAEKKAAGMAVSMLSHYPDRIALVEAMADLAVEEMTHYREVVKILHARGSFTAADRKDDYVIGFRRHIRKGPDNYFLDRLLVGGIIEARGAERFGLVADALEEGPLKRFYRSIARSEERHLELFVDLAGQYFDAGIIEARLRELITAEADIIRAMPIRAALH